MAGMETPCPASLSEGPGSLSATVTSGLRLTGTAESLASPGPGPSQTHWQDGWPASLSAAAQRV
jgi:hypothetical protein